MSIPRHLLICVIFTVGTAFNGSAVAWPSVVDSRFSSVISESASLQSLILIGGPITESQKRKSAAKRARSANRFRGDESRMRQISPKILRSRSLELDGYGRGINDHRNEGHAAVEDFVDALLQAPNPRTRKALASVGLPAIKDVPPIIILNPPVKQTEQEEEELNDLLQ